MGQWAELLSTCALVQMHAAEPLSVGFVSEWETTAPVNGACSSSACGASGGGKLLLMKPAFGSRLDSAYK